MAVQGLFLHIDAATLTTMLAEWQACLTSIAVGQQSYSIAGRSFTRANLAEVANMVGEISFALKVQNGTLHRAVYSDMSNT